MIYIDILVEYVCDNMVSYKMVPVRSMSFFRGSFDDEGVNDQIPLKNKYIPGKHRKVQFF